MAMIDDRELGQQHNMKVPVLNDTRIVSVSHFILFPQTLLKLLTVHLGNSTLR